MKLLIDMNLSPEWIKFFNQYHFHAVHWSEIGLGNENDNIIFQYALENQFIIFTNDLDFGAILAATNNEAPSVFQVRSQELTPAKIGQKVITCLTQFEKSLTQGCLTQIAY